MIDDPYSDEKIKGDPHKTIFIARLVSDVNWCTLLLIVDSLWKWKGFIYTWYNTID